MPGQNFYREKIYTCGDYIDVNIFPVFSRPGQRRSKGKPTSDIQAKLNEKNSRRALARILHANFTSDDLEIHLTYTNDTQPTDDEQAARDARNFLRRVKRVRTSMDLEPLKYVTVTERSRKGRYHHHITINGGIDRDQLEKIWKHGRANSRRLQFDENGLAGLAAYVTKTPIYYRRYNCSKNLIRPEPEEKNARISAKKANELADKPNDLSIWSALYPEYELIECEEPYRSTYNGGIYIFARFRRKGNRPRKQGEKRTKREPQNRKKRKKQKSEN